MMRAVGGGDDGYRAELLLGAVGAGGYPLVSRRFVLDGKTEVARALDPGQRTLVLIGIVSQSNQGSHLQGSYIATSDMVHNFSIDNGGCYRATDPLIGCTSTDANYPGNYISRLGDKLIAAGKFDRVILVPVAVAGTSVLDWAPGGVCNHLINATMRRVRDVGYFAASAVAVLSHIGETDNVLGTSQSAYKSAAGAAYNQILGTEGFPGKVFVSLCSWNGGVASAVVRTAQASLANGSSIAIVGDMDTLGSVYRYDNTHLNAAGADAWASICCSALGMAF